MATIDRVRPAYASWSSTPAVVATTDEYLGRHRHPSGRVFWLRRMSLRQISPRRMLYAARHRRR